MKQHAWKAVLGFGTLATLAGCGASSDPVPYVSAGGYYTGTLDYKGGADAITGLIDESGNGFLIDASSNSTLAIYRLSGSTNGDQYGASFTAYIVFGTAFPNGSDVIAGTITGIVQERISIIGAYVAPDENGAIDLQYGQNLYQVPSSLTSIAGTYRYDSVAAPGNLVTLTIDTLGSVTGKDLNGCSYAGSISVPNTTYNAYSIDKLVTTCGATTTTYSGFGLVSTQSPFTLTLEFDDGKSLAQTGPAVRTALPT